MSLNSLNELKQARQGAKNFAPQTHISANDESNISSNTQTHISEDVKTYIPTNEQTHRLSVEVDIQDFYAFKKWCFSQDAQRKEKVNMTTVIRGLIQGVLTGQVDPFKG